MPEFAGYNIAIRINGSVYLAQRVSCRDYVNDGDTTRSEGNGFGRQIATIRRGEGKIDTATYDSENNPFGAPEVLTPRSTPQIQIYPRGLDGPPYDFPVTLITENNFEGDATALSPLSFSFKSQEDFTAPSES